MVFISYKTASHKAAWNTLSVFIIHGMLVCISHVNIQYLLGSLFCCLPTLFLVAYWNTSKKAILSQIQNVKALCFHFCSAWETVQIKPRVVLSTFCKHFPMFYAFFHKWCTQIAFIQLTTSTHIEKKLTFWHVKVLEQKKGRKKEIFLSNVYFSCGSRRDNEFASSQLKLHCLWDNKTLHLCAPVSRRANKERNIHLPCKSYETVRL